MLDILFIMLYNNLNKQKRVIMKKFEDLIFKDYEAIVGVPNDILQSTMKDWIGSKHAVIEFDNGEMVSVIFGKMFYSNGIDTYEAYASNEDGPRGYLTKEQVSEMMEEIQRIK